MIKRNAKIKRKAIRNDNKNKIRRKSVNNKIFLK